MIKRLNEKDQIEKEREYEKWSGFCDEIRSLAITLIKIKNLRQQQYSIDLVLNGISDILIERNSIESIITQLQLLRLQIKQKDVFYNIINRLKQLNVMKKQ